MLVRQGEVKKKKRKKRQKTFGGKCQEIRKKHEEAKKPARYGDAKTRESENICRNQQGTICRKKKLLKKKKKRSLIRTPLKFQLETNKKKKKKKKAKMREWRRKRENLFPFVPAKENLLCGLCFRWTWYLDRSGPRMKSKGGGGRSQGRKNWTGRGNAKQSTGDGGEGSTWSPREKNGEGTNQGGSNPPGTFHIGT